MPTDPVRTGVVEAFDEARGLGVIAGDDGEQLGFHCVQIADGSRTIPAGSAVRYRRIAGHLGRYEAADITPV